MSFPPDEKSVLLAVKGVGPAVVARLEQLGYDSLAELARADPKHIVTGAAAMVGSTCWKNSPQARAAITAAIAAAQQHVDRRRAHREVPAALQGGHAEPMLTGETFPNLGPKSIGLLQAAGIWTVTELRHLGAPVAYVRVKRTGAPVTLNLLWALEGALSGMHWQEVARQHRTSLLLAVEHLENGH